MSATAPPLERPAKRGADIVTPVIMTGSVLILAWLVLYPLGILLKTGLISPTGGLTFEAFHQVFTYRPLFNALCNSLMLACGVTIASLVLALPMAWAVSRTRLPGRTAIRLLVMVAFVLPDIVGAVAWILLLGPNAGVLNVWFRALTGSHAAFNVYSVPGLIVVLTCNFYPLVFFAVSAALDNMDPAYEEAAQMAGAPAWRASLGVSLPLVMPAIISSAILVFLEAVSAFGAPAALGPGAHFMTLTTEIYNFFGYPPRFELAAAAAIPILVLTALGLAIQKVVLGRRRYTVIAGKATSARAVSIGAWQYVLAAYSWAIIGLTVVLPFCELGITSLLAKWAMGPRLGNFTFYNYTSLIDPSTAYPRGIINTVLVAFVTACLCVALGIVIVWLVERTTAPGRGVLTFISMMMFAFPGIALAIGFALGYNAPPLALYGTLWIYFLAYTAHRFPFAFSYLRAGLAQLAPELEEAARMSGATWSRATANVTLPLMRSAVWVAWIVVFAVCLRELSIPILLYVRGTETMTVNIFAALDSGIYATASALSVVIIAFSLVAVVLVRRLSGKATMEL